MPINLLIGKDVTTEGLKTRCRFFRYHFLTCDVFALGVAMLLLPPGE
jgi:hypothetical protein